MAKALHRPKLAALFTSGEPTWRLLETSQGRRSHRLDEKMQTMSSLAKTEDSEVTRGMMTQQLWRPHSKPLRLNETGLSFLSSTPKERQQSGQISLTSEILKKFSGHKPASRVLVQKMITEFLTSKVFLHTDFVRIYILSKIYMSNIMFLFQIMGVKNVKCLCVTYKSSITS